MTDTPQWEPPEAMAKTAGRALSDAEMKWYGAHTKRECDQRYEKESEVYDVFGRAVLLASPLGECVAVLKHARAGLAWANQCAIEELKGTGDESIYQLPLDRVNALLAKLEDKEPADETR